MMVAVWGATGFVGRHLVASLLDQGLRVRALCRNTAGVPESWAGRVDAVALDLDADEQAFNAAAKGVACMVHCAGTPGPAPADLSAYEAGTRALARAARDQRVERVILLSTVAVCGSARQSEIDSATPVAPDSPYGASRVRAEVFCAEALAGSATALAVVRIPAVVGAGMTGTMLERFFRSLCYGVFLHPGNRQASLACIGVHRLARCLTGLAFLPANKLPAVCQFADNIPWTELVAAYEQVAGRKVLRLPFPGQLAKALAHRAGLTALHTPLQVLDNQTIYADDAEELGLESPAGLHGTKADIQALLQQLLDPAGNCATAT